MSDVIIERRWPEPLSAAHMQAMQEFAETCLDIHRVSWSSSLLSADGKELTCHFTAADAESVRIALRHAGPAPHLSWPATIHDAPGLTDDDIAAANVLVSRSFDEAVKFEDIQAIEDAGRGCLETHRVRFLRTYFAADRKRMLCLYRAPDAESVRIAQHEARMPVERVRAVRRFTPDAR